MRTSSAITQVLGASKGETMLPVHLIIEVQSMDEDLRLHTRVVLDERIYTLRYEVTNIRQYLFMTSQCSLMLDYAVAEMKRHLEHLLLTTKAIEETQEPDEKEGGV
jgi:hypothetical protein